MVTETCDGLCIDSADIGVPGYGVAYPHPGCPLHAPDERCPCVHPNCVSYTHERDASGERIDLRRAETDDERAAWIADDAEQERRADR